MKMSQNNTKHFPTLAPGPPRMFAPQTSTAVTKPKKNSTACLACKAAKRKCSGPEAPCKACRAANTECYFDPSRDLRRKVAVKRTIQELTNHKELLESLMSKLKSAEDEELKNILKMIKDEASFEDIARVVGGPKTRFADPHELLSASRLAISEYSDRDSLEIPTARRPSDAGSLTMASSPEETLLTKPPGSAVNSYARVSLESLCDIPLFEVPANPWTEVTNSDYLVSHLVSLYFTWDHPCSQFLDQRAFLDHMKRGDLGSELCTPLLVNSLLAVASTHSDSLDVLSSPENAYTRGQPFLDEAQRLWEAEEETSLVHSHLPNIQALLLMCCVFKLQGRVSKSCHSLGRAVMLAQQMRLFDIPVQHNKTPEMERVWAITAWGLFNLSSQISVEQKFRVIAPLAIPTSDLTLCGHEDFDWTPYPRSNKITYEKKPAHLPQVRQGLADITKVLGNFQRLVAVTHNSAGSDELWREAESALERLNAWLQRWPSVSDMKPDLVPVPQILLLRIKCLEAIISLFEILNDPTQPRFAQQAQYYQKISAQEMARCFRVYRLSYGLKHIPSQMVGATQIGLRVMANQLEDSDESRQAFAELCRFGMSLSYKYKAAANVIREIKGNALQQNIRLPMDVIAILEDKGYES